MVADVNLEALLKNRISGTTIPLYDKRKDIYNRPVEIVTVK